MDKMEQLKTLLGEIDDLYRAQAVLAWDQQTYMPSSGAEERGNQLSTLARLEHERWTSDQMARLLDDLAPTAGQLPADSDDAALLRVARRNHVKRARVPSKWVVDFTQAATTGQEKWVQARKAVDFTIFRPQLEHIVELRREYASYFAPYQHVYDPLLDDYEPGMKTAEVQAIFGSLRSEQVALVKAIAAKPVVDDSFLTLEYPEKVQWDFGVEVITQFGYDWNRGRQDKSAHPFTIAFGQDDVRITTRFNLNRPAMMWLGTMHECGHALYDLGHDPAHRRTQLNDGASMALHESQSRMWENLVGRSLPFWRHFYPRLQAVFPTQLGNVSLGTFYKAWNRVKPSFIRVESDEATYNLHIMLRLELEIALMEGSLQVKDLPERWNAAMQAYLGLTPPDDSIGVMQDIHWSQGSFGYFPTYALGNLVSAQLWEKIHADIPDLDGQIEKGEFSGLLGWLRRNIHSQGAKYEPQVLVQMVTGSKITPQPYLRYLISKYSAIYGL